MEWFDRLDRTQGSIEYFVWQCNSIDAPIQLVFESSAERFINEIRLIEPFRGRFFFFGELVFAKIYWHWPVGRRLS